MEPAVRGARIEPTIVVTRLETAFFASQDSELPNRQTAFCHSKRCRRERNFWTQRPEAKNPPERPSMSAETGNSKIGVKNPRRNGLFLIGDGFRSSGRLGGGPDRDRTCDPLQLDPAEISRCDVAARLDIHEPVSRHPKQEQQDEAKSHGPWYRNETLDPQARHEESH